MLKAMRRFRRHLSPLAGETFTSTSASLPPVHMGLLTKLNVLTVGLIFLTAVATTGFYLWQQWRDAESELRTEGLTVIAMLEELTELGLARGDRAYIEGVLDSLGPDGDIAYVTVFDANRQPVAERRFRPDVVGKALPAGALVGAGGTTTIRHPAIDGRDYVEIATAVIPDRTGRTLRGDPQGDRILHPEPAASVAPLGYVRVAMSFARQEAQFRKHVIGALTLVAVLVVLSTGTTLFL